MADTFLTLLDHRRPEIEKLLAEWITPDRFFAMAMQVQRNHDLANCSNESLVECIVDVAKMGLELGAQRGHVYIIPYGKTAQAQPGWRGLAFLRLRAGAVLQVDTDVVFNEDLFEVGRSTDGDVFRHLANFKAPRTEKNAYASYARVKLPDGTYQFEVLGRDRIQRHRNHSKQPNSLMWTTFWEEGWRKCPYRVLDKRLPEGVNKEAIERYNLARMAEERTVGGTQEEREPAPDNYPTGEDSGPEPLTQRDSVFTADKAEASSVGPVHVDVVVDESQGVVTSTATPAAGGTTVVADGCRITDREQRLLDRMAKAKGYSSNQLAIAVRTYFGCNIEELRSDQLDAVYERLEREGE